MSVHLLFKHDDGDVLLGPYAEVAVDDCSIYIGEDWAIAEWTFAEGDLEGYELQVYPHNQDGRLFKHAIVKAT